MVSSTAAPPQVLAGAAQRVGARKRRHRKLLVGIFFLLPAFGVNLLVIAGPGVSSLYYAFTDWNGFSPANFTGLENARALFGDSDVRNALLHNVIYMLITLIVPLIMGLTGAFMLSRVRRGTVVFRLVFFIPYLVASVVNAQIWRNLLDPSTGLAAQLNKFGVHWLDDVFFFGDANLALYSIAFVDNWHYWGFLVVLFLAAMQNIDSSRYEAARLDGANAWQEFWHVCLPGIRPTLMFALMILCLGGLLSYDYVYALTQGGPGGASDLMSLLVNRTAFEELEAGYAAFMALSLSVIGGLFLVFFHIIRRNEDETE